jgi:hypothetical protein
MTLSEFQQMDEREQMEAIWGGVFVTNRADNENEILLYQIDSFYVEVYYNKEYNNIRRFRSFSSTDELEIILLLLLMLSFIVFLKNEYKGESRSKIQFRYGNFHCRISQPFKAAFNKGLELTNIRDTH